MAFAHPEAWLWALLVVPLFWIHLGKRRPSIVQVPAVFLWREALGPEALQRRRDVWRRLLSLGADGGALLLIVAAMAEPVGWRVGWKALAAGALGVLAVQMIAVLRQVAPAGPSLWLAMRGAILLGLAAALMGPTLPGPARRVFPVFLIDQSASIDPRELEAAREFVARAVAGRSPWAEVRFAEKPWLSNEPAPPATCRHATNLEAALARACRIAPPTHAPHVILFTDGVATQGHVEAALEAACREGIPISTVPLGSCDPEVFIAAVQVPAAVRSGEPFDALVALSSSREQEGTLEVASPSGVLARRRIQAKQGEHWHAIRLRLDAGPDAKLSVRVGGFGDTLAENNRQDAMVFVLPPRRALLVEGRPESSKHLAKALRSGDFAVEVRAAADLPETPTALESCHAVVLVNVPAAALTPGQMAGLADYVRRGGGLVAIGGDQAFVPGGYRNTTLETILPVESVPSRKTPRQAMAIVFVLDRSQSMEEGRAIDLARDAMRRAAELLGPEDQVGLLAFDEESRWISPIEPLADKAKLLARIESITAGGRTDMAPALQKAFLAIRESFAAGKHIVVLTDGISHPADFEALAEQIARDGVTLSTVALGHEASRPLLEDMARLGKGRAYVCDSPQAVPSVVALETARASRLGVGEEPFFPCPAGQRDSEPGRERRAVDRFSWEGLNLANAPSLLGYGQTRLKADAQMTLAAAGGDPLLAWWRFGEGVCAAFTSDVESRWAAAWLAWPGFSRFWTGVVHGVMRPEEKASGQWNRFSNSFPDEFKVRATDHDLLRAMAIRTGGKYRPALEDVWVVANPGVLPPTPLQGWFLAFAAILLVLDAAARRRLTG